MTEHVVHKISLHLPVSAYDEAVRIQSAARKWTNDSFPKLIESRLNELGHEDEWIYLDRLVIELDDFPWNLAEEQWKTRLSALLSVREARQDAFGMIYNQWFVFMQRGCHERKALMKSVAAYEKFLARQSESIANPALIAILSSQLSTSFVQRLFTFHSKEFILFILGLWCQITSQEAVKWWQEMYAMVHAQPYRVVRALKLLLSQRSNLNRTEVSEIVERLLSSSPFEGIDSKQQTGVTKKTGRDLDELPFNPDLYFECPLAGIVILFPFIKRFLQNIHLVAGDQFVSEDARQKAVYVLHYLVSGKMECEESDLVMLKILCGLSLERVIQWEEDLPVLYMDEVNELLKSVIENWPVLQNTSIDGLREAFLQRTGQLAIKEDHVLLQVEESGVDILLGKIPWGFRHYRLPWMKYAVITEWY